MTKNLEEMSLSCSNPQQHNTMLTAEKELKLRKEWPNSPTDPEKFVFSIYPRFKHMQL